LEQFIAIRESLRSDVDSSVIWRKSSLSGYNANCIEVASLAADTVGVRDSKNPQGRILNFTAAQWDTFLGGVRIGEFDRKPGSR
jgi:hypothetical protein